MHQTLEEVNNLCKEACQQCQNCKLMAGVSRLECLQDQKINPTITEVDRKRACQTLLTKPACQSAHQVWHNRCNSIKGPQDGKAIQEIKMHPATKDQLIPQNVLAELITVTPTTWPSPASAQLTSPHQWLSHQQWPQ